MKTRIAVLDRRFTGLALGFQEGATTVVPAIATTGRLWWKKRHEGFAVQVAERRMENCGAFVDFYNVWATRAFRETRVAAKAFEAELRVAEVLS